MAIFITGISGFIGFHLALYLKQQGKQVFGCDNFNPYYDPKLKQERKKILEDAGISVHALDIQNYPTLEALLQKHSCTHLVHLAAQAGVRYSLDHPEAYVASNLDGFVQILELVRHHPSIKLIYASSSSVYGLNQKIPFSESDPTDAPCSLYGATKKSNELMAHAYHHMYGISVTGLRFFTVYGPWGRPDMAYYSFTKAICEGAPIQIYNRGKMKRDFTYVEDIVEGIAAAIDLGASCEIFNLGNHHPEELFTLVSLIEKYTGKKALTEMLPMQAGDVTQTYADISKAQRLLNFHPKVSLDEGIKRFVSWYLDHERRAT